MVQLHQLMVINLGIVGEGSISASQITFPVNSQNTVSKTSLGLNTATKNIEGKAVTNSPTNRDYFDINVKVGSFKSGNNISTLSSSSTLVISGTNTLVISVDDITSGTITMPTDTYESNECSKELEEAINDDSTLKAAGKK